jgi:hypothetical protein
MSELIIEMGDRAPVADTRQLRTSATECPSAAVPRHHYQRTHPSIQEKYRNVFEKAGMIQKRIALSGSCWTASQPLACQAPRTHSSSSQEQSLKPSHSPVATLIH